MSKNSATLKTLFVEAFRQLDRTHILPDVEVKFYPYAGLHHTIRLRHGRVYARISDVLADAPVNVHRALAFILVAKLLRKPVPEVHDRVYRTYTCTPKILRASDLARRNRGRKVLSSSRGMVYDLEKMFARLNRVYFDGKLEKPTLSWSQRRTRSILGHHDPVHKTIVISKTLDSQEIPQWFVEYILYHEMLHVKHPARLINGRRFYHTNQFRSEERQFPYFEQALELLDRFARRGKSPRARAA